MGNQRKSRLSGCMMLARSWGAALLYVPHPAGKGACNPIDGGAIRSRGCEGAEFRKSSACRTPVPIPHRRQSARQGTKLVCGIGAMTVSTKPSSLASSHGCVHLDGRATTVASVRSWLAISSVVVPVASESEKTLGERAPSLGPFSTWHCLSRNTCGRGEQCGRATASHFPTLKIRFTSFVPH